MPTCFGALVDLSQQVIGRRQEAVNMSGPSLGSAGTHPSVQQPPQTGKASVTLTGRLPGDEDRCERTQSRHARSMRRRHKPPGFSCCCCPFWRENRLRVCSGRQKQFVDLMQLTAPRSSAYPQGSTCSGVEGHAGHHPLHGCQLTLRSQ